jgi:peptidoglycan/xylan/chitin deacetylase (PgdA/CDA1 family)
VSPAFVLKVDVDTHVGLRDGAPRLLELFARHGVRASWFVAMGPDRTGRAVARAFRQPGFLKKMLRSRAPGMYPLSTMLRGTLLPSVAIVASQPERLREIDAAGHEVGVHGFDHVRWHDALARLTLEEVRAQLGSATDLFASVVGRRPAGFAAPGWQCTGTSLRVVDELGYRYRSDTRGKRPYRPSADGYLSSIPEIPTTLPTLDEVIGAAGRTPDELARAYHAWILPEELNVHTIHTEVEGGPYLEQLDLLLTYVKDILPVRTLGEVAAELPDVAQLPIAGVRPGTLPGRGGTVACQVVS